ncbi:MAG TPA: CHAT domain-containing tetratricopeptide repeat protein [Vicinamibacterales bacterium]|nr:CHAT domain-containing tetratricopeptide repeat protein [Vicinamibacterales bacterium]
MILRTAGYVLCAVSILTAGSGRQDSVDPALKLAIDRFFATQEAEDVDAYLALWSATATRPQPLQLKYIFDSGDDKFSDITIQRVERKGEATRVRVTATRERTERSRIPGGPPMTRRSTMVESLTYVREGEDWKLTREGPATDDLAVDLVEETTPEARERLYAADPDLVNDSLSMSLNRLGSLAASRRQYAQAQIIYERMVEAARRTKNQRFEGEALQNLANALYFQRKFEPALSSYSARLAIERDRGDDAAMAAALGGMGTVHYARAEYTQALERFRLAAAIQEVLNDEAGLGTTLISTGNVRYLQGDYTAAVADYRRSREINKRIFNTTSEAIALEGLGRTLMAQGDLAGALDAFAAVLAERKARNDITGQGTALMNIGEAHFNLGNVEIARGSFDEGRRDFETAKDAANSGRAWQAIALTDLVAGKFPAAEDEYGRSIAACTSIDDKECVGGATVGLGFAQNEQDKFAEAAASYRKAIDIFSALGRRELAARAEIGLSQSLSGGGQHDAAVEAAVRARRTAVGLNNDDVLWRAQVAEARALRRKGARPEALGAAGAAIYAVEHLQELAQTRPGSPVSRDSAAAYATLAVLQAENGDASTAFETVERLRVHALRTALATSQREIARGMSLEEREEERAMSGELVSLQAQITREKGLPRPDAARLERLDRDATEAAEKLAAWRDALFTRLPDLRTWRGLFTPASSAELDKLLGEDTVLLDFIVDDADLLVLAAWHGDSGVTFAAKVAPLSRKDLADRIAQMLRPAALKDPAEWRRTSADLVKALPGDALDRASRAKTVIVIPHEALWRVPFEAFPVGDHYLADVTTVTYAASISALIRTPAITEAAPGVVVAIGAPAIGAAARERVKQTAPGWSMRADDVLEREVTDATAGSDDGQAIALTAHGATERAARESLPKAGVIHLAAPFRVNGASPLFSPILLADEPEDSDPQPTNDDGTLEAREIVNMDLHARVAVLSDPAALSMRDGADGAAIVQWAWRASGVPTLVLPRWASDEAVCAELLREAHRGLKEGRTPTEAFQGARHLFRGRQASSAPFYWAGWLIIGR